MYAIGFNIVIILANGSIRSKVKIRVASKDKGLIDPIVINRKIQRINLTKTIKNRDEVIF